MYVRKSSSTRNGKTYTTAQIVEGYRTEDGKSRQRILFNLGSVEKLLDKDVDNLINGLLRIKGEELPDDKGSIVSSKRFGQIWAAMMLWKELKITGTLQKAARRSKKEFDLISHIQVMVLNRLDDPRSKLGLLSWLEEVYLPNIDRKSVTYSHLLRAMDFLIENKQLIEQEIARRFLTIFDNKLTMCFYDITSSYFETAVDREDDIRKYGYSRDHRRDRRQVVIGVVMSDRGIPLAHYTFEGNTADRSTVIEVVDDIRTRFGVDEVALVADKGMSSSVNYGWLVEAGVQFILGESKRIRNDVRDGVVEAEAARLARPEAERETAFCYETAGNVTMLGKTGHRMQLAVRHIYSYNPATAVKQRLCREKSLDKLFDLADSLQSSGRKAEEAYHLLRSLSKRHGISRLVAIPDDPVHDRLTLKKPELSFEQQADGWFVVSTNTRSADGFSADDVINHYKNLQLVENGFRMLKSTLDIRPMYHWTSDRIRAHIFICFIALQISTLFNLRLRPIEMTFQRAAQQLRKMHVVDWKSGKSNHKALTAITAEQLEIFKTLQVAKPSTKSLVVSDF